MVLKDRFRLMTVFTMCALTGCESDTTNEIEAVLTGAGPSGWQVSETSDPMTDSRLQVGEILIKSGRYSVETKVSCTDDVKLRYSFSTFEGENAAVLRKTANPAFGMLWGQKLYHTVIEMRLDDGESERVVPYDEDYSNNFRIGRDSDVTRMGNAQVITMRVPLASDTLVFKVDQSDHDIRGLLDNCRTDQPEPNVDEPEVDETEDSDNTSALMESDNDASDPVDYRLEMQNLSEAEQEHVLLRAIQDAGFSCDKVSESNRLDHRDGDPRWRAVCDKQATYAISVNREGTANVQTLKETSQN